MLPPLRKALEAAGRGGLAARLGDHLTPRVAALWARATAAWPRLAVEPERFLAHMARHLPDDDPEQYLATVNVEDLYLACACAGWDPAAVAELERTHLAHVPAAIARLGAAGLPVDEITQRLRERFIVGDAGRGKIADYSGRGPLLAWVRAAAVREAIDHVRSEKARRKDTGVELVGLPAGPGANPELQLLLGRYAGHFQAALATATETLPARDRNVLRYSYIDGLSIDEIASLYHVHRATAARWIVHARIASCRRRAASCSRARRSAIRSSRA